MSAPRAWRCAATGELQSIPVLRQASYRGLACPAGPGRARVNTPGDPAGTQPCSAIATRQASPNRARRPWESTRGVPSRTSLLYTMHTVIRSGDHRSRGSSASASISRMISATRGSMARVLSGGDVLPCPARQGPYLRRRRVLRRMRLRRRTVQRWGQQRNGSRPAGAQTGTLGEEGPQFEKRTAARGRYFRIDLLRHAPVIRQRPGLRDRYVQRSGWMLVRRCPA